MELGKKIGKVEEVETDDAGECASQFAQARISINVTEPLKKVVYLQQDGVKISMSVLCKKLPNFCFCCAYIGHQYKGCLSIKGSQKKSCSMGHR